MKIQQSLLPALAFICSGAFADCVTEVPPAEMQEFHIRRAIEHWGEDKVTNISLPRPGVAMIEILSFEQLAHVGEMRFEFRSADCFSPALRNFSDNPLVFRVLGFQPYAELSTNSNQSDQGTQ